MGHGTRRAAAGAVLAGAVLTGAVLTGAVLAGAAGAQDADTGLSVAYDPLAGPPGTVIGVTGRCVYHGQPAEHVLTDLLDGAREVAHVDNPVQADGTFTATVQVPAAERAGPHRLTSSCVLDDMALASEEVPFAVTTPATTAAVPPSSAPPTTAAPATTAPVSVTAAPTTVSPEPTRVAGTGPSGPSTVVPPRSTSTTLHAKQVSAAGGPLTLRALGASALLAGASVVAIGRRRRRDRPT